MGQIFVSPTCVRASASAWAASATRFLPLIASPCRSPEAGHSSVLPISRLCITSQGSANGVVEVAEFVHLPRDHFGGVTVVPAPVVEGDAEN